MLIPRSARRPGFGVTMSCDVFDEVVEPEADLRVLWRRVGICVNGSLMLFFNTEELERSTRLGLWSPELRLLDDDFLRNWERGPRGIRLGKA